VRNYWGEVVGIHQFNGPTSPWESGVTKAGTPEELQAIWLTPMALGGLTFYRRSGGSCAGEQYCCWEATTINQRRLHLYEGLSNWQVQSFSAGPPIHGHPHYPTPEAAIRGWADGLIAGWSVNLRFLTQILKEISHFLDPI
jgi:hypothetical protein